MEIFVFCKGEMHFPLVYYGNRNANFFTYIWGIVGRFDQAVTYFCFQVCIDGKKNDTNFQIFLKIFLAAMVEIVMEWGPLSILLKFKL